MVRASSGGLSEWRSCGLSELSCGLSEQRLLERVERRLERAGGSGLRSLRASSCESERGTRGSGAWHVCRARVREVAHRRATRCRAVQIKQSTVERPTQAAAVQCGRWWIRWPTHAEAREQRRMCAHTDRDAGEERFRPSRVSEWAAVGDHLT